MTGQALLPEPPSFSLQLRATSCPETWFHEAVGHKDRTSHGAFQGYKEGLLGPASPKGCGQSYILNHHPTCQGLDEGTMCWSSCVPRATHSLTLPNLMGFYTFKENFLLGLWLMQGRPYTLQHYPLCPPGCRWSR